MSPVVMAVVLALVGVPMLWLYASLRRRRRSLRGETVYRLFTYGYLLGTGVTLVGLGFALAVSTAFTPVQTPFGPVRPVVLRDVGAAFALAGLAIAAGSSVAVSNPNWIPARWQR